jgi:pimeloyl-ACP methyl ester carboxylesterase
VALVVLVLVSSCSSGDGDSSSASAQSAERAESVPTTSGEGSTSLDWTDCADDMAAAAGLQCATLEVPLDPDEPDADQTELALARQRSTGSADERIGSLIINPGGPGGSGIEFLANGAAAFPESLTDRFDLVSFDPRGVGASSPVHCIDDATKAEQLEGDLSPDTPEEIDAAVTEQEEFLAGCLANSPEMLTFMSTADVAADL